MYYFQAGITTYDFLPIVDGYESAHEHDDEHAEEEAGILGILQVNSDDEEYQVEEDEEGGNEDEDDEPGSSAVEEEAEDVPDPEDSGHDGTHVVTDATFGQT